MIQLTTLVLQSFTRLWKCWKDRRLKRYRTSRSKSEYSYSYNLSLTSLSARIKVERDTQPLNINLKSAPGRDFWNIVGRDGWKQKRKDRKCWKDFPRRDAQNYLCALTLSRHKTLTSNHCVTYQGDEMSATQDPYRPLPNPHPHRPRLDIRGIHTGSVLHSIIYDECFFVCTSLIYHGDKK